ncbi:hypothetical protein HHI36_018023 [Cryptolaemus montrouzieri]|uniref:Uncharacterized protein n=1 Tax=Cryptolaemus montrouzieri TaxID=559131 RepID=A0ABD2NZE3_9CUCU
MVASGTEKTLAAAVVLLFEEYEFEIPLIDTIIDCEDVTLSLSDLNVPFNVDDLIVIEPTSITKEKLRNHVPEPLTNGLTMVCKTDQSTVIPDNETGRSSSDKDVKEVDRICRRQETKAKVPLMIHDAPKEGRRFGPRCNRTGKCRKWQNRKCYEVTDGTRRLLRFRKACIGDKRRSLLG